MVNQKTQTQQGNANLVLYELAAQQPAAFNDVTAGTIAMPCAKNKPNCSFSNNNDTYGILSGYNTTTGYDLATGLGSVNASNLVNQWANVTNGLQATVTTLTLNPTTSPIPHGTSVPFNVSVAPAQGGGTPTGRVSLLAGTGPDIADFSLNGGSVSSATSSLPGGSYTVTAHYAGDGTFSGSNSSPVSVTVSPETSVTSVIALTPGGNGSLIPTNTGPYGDIFLQATVQGQSGAGNATGTVTFTVDGQGISGNPFPLNANGQVVTPSAITNSPGPHSIAASYSGDASFNAGNSGAASLTIAKAATTIGVSPSSTSITAGSTVTFTAIITTSSMGANPTGTITLLSGTTAVGSPVTVGGIGRGLGNTAVAVVVFPTTQLPTGTDSVTAQYSGDSNYSGSNSSPVIVHVLGQTTTVVRSSSSTIQQGSSVTFTTSVTANASGGPAVTGTVQFSQNGSNFGSVALSGGQAQISATSLPSGTLNIVANYSGDTNYGASSGTFAQTVIAGPSFTISANPASIVASAPGASAVTTLTFTGLNGFAAVIPLPSTVCSGLPAQSSCVFSPSTVTLSPTATTATATLTITTTAASSVAPRAVNRPSSSNWQKRSLVTLTPAAVTLIALCLGIWTMGIGRIKRAWLPSAALAVIAALLLSIAGCGSTTKNASTTNAVANAGTPAPSTSTVTITITGGSITQVSTVILTVQ